VGIDEVNDGLIDVGWRPGATLLPPEPPPHMHIDVHVLTPADVLGPKVAAHTLRSLMPIFERFRVATQEELDPETYADRLLADLAASGSVLGWPPLVSAWARR